MAADRGSRLKFVRASLIAGLAIVSLSQTAFARTPTLMWAGAKRVNILCNVAGGPGIDHLALTKQLCSEIERLAVKDSPLPVATIAIGDPAALAIDAVTLLVHGSVTRLAQERLLAFSVRPYRTSSEASVLFGAAPRVATLSSSGAGPALNAALAAALSETLPWQAQPPGPQRIDRSN